LVGRWEMRLQLVRGPNPTRTRLITHTHTVTPLAMHMQPHPFILYTSHKDKYNHTQWIGYRNTAKPILTSSVIH
jgi:hypothetical protein